MNSKVKFYSDITKELITIAAEIAFDLGNDHVSTIHFFLANCKMVNYNPRDFLFDSEDSLNEFYASQHTGASKIWDGKQHIELTEEANKAIVYSLKLNKKFRTKEVQPIHLLLAATRVKNSQFLSICNDRKNAGILLYNFYKEKGYITEVWRFPFLKKLEAFFF